MKFKPQTPEEIATAGLIPAKTILPFEVISAEDSQSKKGNDMLVAELRLFTEDGKTRQMTVYLLEAMPALLFHFCTYSGLATEYGSGTLKAADCVGKTGYAEIGIKIDKTGQYAPQNVIKDFVRPEALKPGAMPKAGESDSGDVPY
jgi:hypothetical protein